MKRLLNNQSNQYQKNAMKHPFLREIRKNGLLYIIALPGIIYFLVFCYFPMFGIVIAFQNFNPIKGFLNSEFVGFSNFVFFFKSGDWLKVTRNTLLLNAAFIVGEIFMQISIAIMISEISSKLFKRISQTSILLPNFISWPIISMFAITLLSTDMGIINNMLESVGVKTVNFYSNAAAWPIILLISRIWKSLGVGTIIYLSAITGIDPQIYESARIDGASAFKCITNITIPMLSRTTAILLLLSVGKIFYGDFGMIYNLVGDNPQLYPTTDIIDTYVFRALRQQGNMSMSAAVGLAQSIFGFVVVVSMNTIIKRKYPDHALF